MHGKRHDGTIGHTKIWRQYKKTTHCACLLKKTGWIAGPIEITAQFYFPTMQSDLDNRLKALFDALQGVCYVNDRQIRKYTNIEALIDAKNPRVDVVLREYSHGLPK
jgi:Holliday junction resolvase RusA-like endonuclease